MSRSFALAWFACTVTVSFLACGGVDRNGNGDGDGGALVDAGSGGADAQPSVACAADDDCEAGACVGGNCCATAQACVDVCCNAGDTCFADQCVAPGTQCYTSVDCESNEYCELGLPGPSAPPPAEQCIELPPTGHCLAELPACGPGDDPATAACVPVCEYRPPAGNLTATARWSWGKDVQEYPDFIDVWSTPAVGRLYDANCDGAVDRLDPPNIVFVSGKLTGSHCSAGTPVVSRCHTGVLRVINGATGETLWSLRKASDSSVGFMGNSLAIGDLDNDGDLDIAAITGEGYVVIISGDGEVLRTSDQKIAGAGAKNFGWGGGLAIADMNHDGFAEIAFGRTLFTTAGGGLTRVVNIGTAGTELSLLANLDDDDELELLRGREAYNYDGSPLWIRSDIPNGYAALGDFDNNGDHEVVLVSDGLLYILNPATGANLVAPATLPGSGNGGPPTVADFDGDGVPEVGVANADFYSVHEIDLERATIEKSWQTPNHDFSSSMTGSTVFDFQGDGRAEVVYNDECFLWVYDGKTGDVRFATPTSSFTSTEASVVADVDGDGHAEMLMIANGADPSANGWKCNVSPWNQPDPANNRPAWQPPPGETAYRGLTLWADSANSWVGTRTLWNQHSYHVTNICDDTDNACASGSYYGQIPQWEKENVQVAWLNNYRQNIQEGGIFDAPDATVTVTVDCEMPLVVNAHVRNVGAARLAAGALIDLYTTGDGEPRKFATIPLARVLFPGQTGTVSYTVAPADDVAPTDPIHASVYADPDNPTFHECREDNNISPRAMAECVN